jgi:succinate dehydrogenase / fumarate reductase, cytochrome b subunit
MARNTARPLSPHLGIWKWQVHFFISICNRMMGAGLATVGVAGLVWWLTALASGPKAYAIFMAFAQSWYGLIFPIGLTFAFFFHMAAGIRHFVMDTGAGFELKTNQTWAWATLIAAVMLTGLTWLIILNKGL